MHGIPKIREIYSILFNEETCKNFLLQIGAFYSEKYCERCGFPMKYYQNLDALICPKKNCRCRVSNKKNTFFSNCKINCCDIMHLAYLWLSGCKVQTAIIHTGFSSHTICDYYLYFRKLVSSFPEQEERVIGGENIIVEIDECKLGKRKYNRGHHVDGVWILGGVERTEERRTFFIPVETRDSETLLSIINRYVAPGSIVHTDFWKGYSQIENLLGLTHFKVNHSESFINEMGIHTNSIEGTWNGLKISISPRNRVKDGIEMYLGEFQWRRKHTEDLWNAFLNCLIETYYD